MSDEDTKDIVRGEENVKMEMIPLENPRDGNASYIEMDTVDTLHQENVTTGYSTKKMVVQGMMDLALITANANQLRTLLEYGSKSSTFKLVMGLIILSLCIQVLVGLTLIIFREEMNPSNNKEKSPHIKRVDNLVLTGVFLVTVLNVFIATFTTIQHPSSSQAVH